MAVANKDDPINQFDMTGTGDMMSRVYNLEHRITQIEERLDRIEKRQSTPEMVENNIVLEKEE